jgi:hypothetical protein
VQSSRPVRDVKLVVGASSARDDGARSRGEGWWLRLVRLDYQPLDNITFLSELITTGHQPENDIVLAE